MISALSPEAIGKAVAVDAWACRGRSLPPGCQALSQGCPRARWAV